MYLLKIINSFIR